MALMAAVAAAALLTELHVMFSILSETAWAGSGVSNADICAYGAE